MKPTTVLKSTDDLRHVNSFYISHVALGGGLGPHIAAMRGKIIDTLEVAR
jgi:hypothetical protein